MSINKNLLFQNTPINLDKNDMVQIAGKEPSKLANKYGTPLFIYCEDEILNQYKKLTASYLDYKGEFCPYYSFKANNNKDILCFIKKLNMGAEICSIGELKLALKLGFKKNKIIFHGNSKSSEDIEFAIINNILIIADSFEELSQIIEITEQLGVHANVGIRLDLNLEDIATWNGASRKSKFGISIKVIQSVIKKIKNSKKLVFKCLHAHIGSQVLHTKDFNLFLSEYLKILSLFYDNDIFPEMINIGGGYPIIYDFSKQLENININNLTSSFDIFEFGNHVSQELNKIINSYELQLTPDLIVEVGRYMTGSCGVLITKVNNVKKGNPIWINIDAGCNLIPDVWTYDWYFECIAVNSFFSETEISTYNIAGPLCDSGDVLGINRDLPKLTRNDLLLFLQVGAYQEVQISNFNLLGDHKTLYICSDKKTILEGGL